MRSAALIPSRLFAHTYLWVEGMVATGKLKNETAAQYQLAKTVGRSNQAITQWYASGRLMRKHNMSPDDVNAHSVYVVRYAENSVSAADYLTIVSAVKQGVESGKIKAMMNRGEVRSGLAVHRRLRTLARANLSNKTGGKIEMMVAYKVMCKAYGLEEGMMAFYDPNGKRIHHVGLNLDD